MVILLVAMNLVLVIFCQFMSAVVTQSPMKSAVVILSGSDQIVHLSYRV